MSGWDPHLISPSEVSAEPLGLGALLPRFMRWQAERWPRLATALSGLSDVEQRQVQVAERAVTLQFNPARAVNSTAKVDAASIEKRPCFLCPSNLPPEEKGLAFGSELVILANPAPILPLHFVLAHRQHTPQRVQGAVEGLVDFAIATQGALTAVYNGPVSGASAPDHLHVQAVASGVLVEEVHALKTLRDGGLPGEVLHDGPGLRAWSDSSSGRWIIGFVGVRQAVVDAIRGVVDSFGQTTDAVEPPLNLLAVGGPGGPSGTGEVVVLMFVRGAHRPRCYYAEEPALRLVSPGAIDMAGVVVTVRREDYVRLRSEDLVQVFSEVSRPADLHALRHTFSRRP